MKAAPDPTPDPETARRSFRSFLERVPSSGRHGILHDSDADGLAAGVLLERFLERSGRPAIARMPSGRERSPWSPANARRIAGIDADALFVLDLGSGATPLLRGTPTCFIDHHRPAACSPDATLISAYSWRPTPSTSVLVWTITSPDADLSDLEWVAAIGAIGDLGDRAPFDVVERSAARHGRTALRKSVTLLNAARRSSSYDVEAAATALLEHPDPASLARSTRPSVRALRDAAREVRVELDRAKRIAPRFSGKVALLELRSPCQVHPLIARIWSNRLKGYIVIAANEGYLPGRVNFSVRTSGDVDLIRFLHDVRPPGAEASYGGGHDRATGGSLPVETWSRWIEDLGFSA